MSVQRIEVTIDSNLPLSVMQAKNFVQSAVSTVRQNYADAVRAGIVTGIPAKAIVGATMFVQPTPKLGPAPAAPKEWTKERMIEAGSALTFHMTQRLGGTGGQAAKNREDADDFLHWFLTSDLAAPEVKALYAAMPNAG